MSTPLDTFIHRLDERGCKPRKSGTGYVALCPAHNDKGPSLSISESADGNALIHCFAGCDNGSVLSALGMETRDLFANPLPLINTSNTRSNGRCKPVLKADRKPLCDDVETVIVNCSKTLRESESLQKHLLEKRGINLDTARRFGIGYDRERSRWSIPIRDHEGLTIGLKFHWSNGMQDPKAVSETGSQVGLFGCDFITGGTDLVVITEGEFDALAVYQSTGINAVSSSGGAATVKAEWSGLLEGHPITLFLDNDKPGREATEKWKTLLGPLVLEGRIPTLRIVSKYPTGCKDATDILLQHGSDAVKQCLNNAEPWTPEQPTEIDQEENQFNVELGIEVSRCTDVANAERFRDQNRANVRYCVDRNDWLCWDGRNWRPNAENEVMSLAKQTARTIYHEAGNAQTKEEREKLCNHAKASESRRSIESMVSLARSEVGIPIRQENVDANLWIIPLENGTYDLKEDRFREHRREDYCTRLAPVSFDGEADCPKFLDFLMKIMEGNDSLISFLQRVLGICLTGDVGVQKLFLLYGRGANGKTTLLNVIKGILGPYMVRIDSEILLSKNYTQHPTGLTDLHGARLAWTSETGDGRRLAEDVVKSLSGGDRLKGRRMREDFFEWSPTHKLFLCTNHKPNIKGRDHGIWRRICLIPFTFRIPDAEKIDCYENVLLEDRSGIFNWLLDGLRDYRENGLQEPDEVRNATEAYRGDEDVLGPWIDGCCLLGPDYHTPAADLWSSYESYCQQIAVDPVSKPKFWTMLSELGIEPSRTKASRLRDGIGLRVTQADTGGVSPQK